MRPGFQFEAVVGETRFRIFYRPHFVERYELDASPGRPAVKRFLSESVIKQKVEEALPQIDEYMVGSGKGAEGIIQSSGTKLNMMFSILESEKGVQVTMKSMMIKKGFVATSPKDYVVKVHSEWHVHFPGNLSKPLSSMVLDDLIPQMPDLEVDNAYHMNGEFVDYWIDRTEEDHFYVDDANWVRDTFEFSIS